jgi:hypothetical protein
MTMKLVARLVAALALVGFATPALPCSAEKANKTVTQTGSSTQTGGAVAKADKGEKSQKSDKSQKSKGDQAHKAAATN